MLNLNKKQVLARTFPSILFLIAGFLVMFIWVMPGEVVKSFSAGWILGGFIWGWSITKSWFPRFSLINSLTGGVGASLLGVIRIVSAIMVGFVALPIGIVITIITIVSMSKDAQDKARAEAAENTQEAVQDTENND